MRVLVRKQAGWFPGNFMSFGFIVKVQNT